MFLVLELDLDAGLVDVATPHLRRHAAWTDALAVATRGLGVPEDAAKEALIKDAPIGAGSRRVQVVEVRL